MATYTKAILSGSTDGLDIAINASSTAGTLIHTGPSTTSILDEIFIYAKNEVSATSAQVLTILWGADSQAGTSQTMRTTIPQRDGLYLVIPGLIIQGNATPLVIRAVCNESSAVAVMGYVNRIDQT